MNWHIEPVTKNKKAYLNLLLLADESEAMIDRYLERGEMFVATAGGETVAACVVTDEGNALCELKNLAVRPDRRRQGCGSSWCNGCARTIGKNSAKCRWERETAP